jgi:hypothetical protein
MRPVTGLQRFGFLRHLLYIASIFAFQLFAYTIR